MKNRYNTLFTTFQRQKGQQELLKSSIQVSEVAITSLDAQISIETEVLRLLQLSSEATWGTTKNLVENIVSRALHAIFYDKTYKFILKQEIKRNAQSVSFAVLDNEMELDLVDELGGGISDVVALVLRIAFLVLHRPKIRPFLVLDEPLKHLWVGYQPYAGQFLQQVCAELGLTVLVVTHQKELSSSADQVFQIVKSGSTCKIIESKEEL